MEPVPERQSYMCLLFCWGISNIYIDLHPHPLGHRCISMYSTQGFECAIDIKNHITAIS